MRHRLPPWLVLLLLVGGCGGVIALVALFRSGKATTGNLVARLPADDAVILALDFDALRKAGIVDLFAGTNVVQEPEYRSFVEQTGFDYLHDLDLVLASFHKTGTYFLLRGNFDWRRLRDYVTSQGGTCYNTLCRVEGSTKERRISFFPLQPDIMALAVSEDDYAVVRLQARHAEPPYVMPQEPVWSVVPVGSLRKAANLPAGTRMFIRALEGAERLVLAAGPEGIALALRADVTCRSDPDAASLLRQLQGATTQLRSLIAKERQAPNPRDLSGLLSSGTFEQKGKHVYGRWPFERGLLESLAGSAI